MLLAIFATSDKESLASEATQTKTKTKTNKPNTNKQPRHQRKGHSRKTKDETVKRSPDSHLIFDSKKWPDTREWYRYAGSGTLLQSSWTATQSPLLRIPNTYKQTNKQTNKQTQPAPKSQSRKTDVERLNLMEVDGYASPQIFKAQAWKSLAALLRGFAVY